MERIQLILILALCYLQVRCDYYDGHLSEPGITYGSLSPNSSLTFPNPFPESPLSQLTIGLWIKRPECTSSTTALLSCKSALEVTCSETYSMNIFAISVSPAVSFVGCFPGWVHVAFIFNETTLSISLNGELNGTQGETTGQGKVMGNPSEMCYLGNDGTLYGVTAFLRHLYILSVVLDPSQLRATMNSVQSWDQGMLFYSKIDSELKDEYKAGVELTSSGPFKIVKKNDPEFICHCTDNGVLGVQFDKLSNKLSNSAGIAQSQQFTVELWIYVESLSLESDNVILSHDFFWKLLVEPSAQSWVVSFYSAATQTYVQYPTFKFSPLNTWQYVAITFDYNKVAIVTYPPYGSTDYNLDSNKHTVVPGSPNSFSVSKFSGYIYTLKYWNKPITISPQTIQYPQNVAGSPPTGLLYFYSFTYNFYSPHITQYGAITNLGTNSQEYIPADSTLTFNDAPPACNQTVELTGSVCADKGWYLRFANSGSEGVVTWMSEYSNELTFEVWIRIADPSQSSTLLEIQDVSKKTQFKAVLSASAFICYPNVNSLTSTAFAKITTDMTRGWSHLTCVVNGTASKTTVFFNNGTQALSSAASNVPISVQTTGIFNAFIGNNFVGYLRELRLWKNILSQERISLYRYQGIDTTDIILQPTLLLYFPFDTESDVSLFHSGLTSVDPAPAKFVQLEDHLSIYYAESDTQLLICPVGFVLSENQCISPEFDIKITDLQTDYKVELIKNLPDTSTSFSYKWQYPEVSPADPELQEYLNQKIKNMTHNSLLIFKPALKTKYTISFSVDILPSIYNKVFGTISITKSGDMEYNIDCPVLSLNETEITLSNLNSSNVTVLAQFTQCMVPYVINSVEWQVVDGRPEVEFFSTSNSSKEIMTISQPNFASYDIGVRYEVEVTANVSMESSEGEKFFTFPNASAYITRHAYKLTFISNNTYTILPHEPMQVSGKYRVMRNNIYDPSVDAEVEVDIHCPSEFSTTTCNQLKNGSALHPYERIQKEINPGTYTFIVDGEWRTLKDSEAVYVTVLPPDPFIENKNVSIFYDYVVYQLSANTELECSMADMKYKWFYYGEYDALSEKYEVKLEKKNIMEPKKLVAEIYCNTTNKRLYDSYRDVYEPDSSFKLNIDTKYSLSPLKDPIVVNSDEGNGGDRGGYVLEIKDLVDNCWVPSQVIPFSAPETEVFLPFTNKLRVVKYKGTSITEKVYNVSMINVHSINVGNYINKYMNSSEDFTKLLYTIMHVRNTHNKFSTTQRSLILNYLSTFTYNGTQHNTFLPLYIAALKHIGSELSTIETTELWLDTVAHCLKVRNEFLWSDWEATVQNITEMLSQVLVPLIKSFSLSTARQINLVKKTKGIIAILQEWILSELSVYENYTLNNDLYSISAFSFSTHLPPLILNQVLSFNHSKQAIVLDLPLSFLENGIFSETNRSTFFSFGLTAVSYSTKYLFNENFTALTPISKGQLNVSLHYQDENGTFTQLVQGEKVASALFKPVANFGKIVSPKNISESYCYCSGFGVENITCRTRIDFNSSAIVCEFDSTGPLFASVDYVPFVEPPPFFGNVILLSVYGSGVLLLLFSFICLCERWDKSDCKKMDSANDVKQIYDQLQTYALSVYSLPYSFMGTIILVAKLFHPFVGILFKYNPVISRTNRISLTFFFMQTMSTFILFILKQWNVEPFVATYGYFWCCFAASLGLWLVYMVIMWAYHVLMCKSYEVRTCVMKDADPYAKCGIMDATYRQEKEGFGGESKSVDGVDEDNLWETFNDAKEENTKVAGGRDESNIRKQTEEGRVLPINNSVFIASNLSVIIECENKLEASSSRSAIDGKTTEAESRAKVLTKGRNPPMIGENPERPAKFQKANCAENLPVHQNSSSGILKKYEPPCKEPPAATPPLIRNFTAPIKFSVKDCPPPINSESVLMNVVGKANPKPEIVRADEDLRPEIEIREASHESEPIRFNSQRFNTDGILMKYEKKNRKTTLRRDCITEYVEPPEEEKVEEAQQPNEEPPCDITSLQTARIHKGLTFSIFRDVVSLAILHVTMIGSVYYVSNVIFVTEQQVILRWLILCAVVGAAILFLWNTVYVVLIGVIAHIMSRLRLECMKKILRVVVPKEVEAIVIKYAFKV